MVIERQPINLLYETYSYIGRQPVEQSAAAFKAELLKHLDKLKKFVDVDIDELSNEEFFKLLVSIYSIRLDMKDYLKLFSKKYNKQYNRVTKIPTNMTLIDRATEGHGRSFDWWDQLYQVEYDAAISNDTDFDYNKVYSKKEIEKLVSDKTIILLKQENSPIQKKDVDFNEESFQYFPIDFDITESGDIMSGFILDNYDLYIDMLRENITQRKILMDIRDYIVYLNSEILAVTSCSGPILNESDEISTLCKKWYDSSNTKNEFELLKGKFAKNKKPHVKKLVK